MSKRTLTRVLDEPAFVLHQYDWSESSLILEVLTRQHGRVALAAKGVKRPTSQFRAVLLPLQPLRLHFSGEGDIRNLRGAEWAGGHVMPTGEALLSGCYLNELLLRLLARDDPHPTLFDHYRQAVQVLASGWGGLTSALLRAFELLLLRDMGLLPDLRLQTLTLQALDADQAYALWPEAGLRESDEAPFLRGQRWLELAQALTDPDALSRLLRLCAEWPSEDRSALQTQLRHLLHYHCGVSSLRTRQVMMELQAL